MKYIKLPMYYTQRLLINRDKCAYLLQVKVQKELKPYKKLNLIISNH